MTSGVLETSLGLENSIEKSAPDINNPLYCSLDGDTSTEGSTSPDLLITNEAPSLNANAPAFTSVSSMTPVLITKNIDIGNERWKPTATIVEENINTIPLADLPQPFIAPDGLYYWPADMINGFQPQPVLIESLPNGTATVVTDQEAQTYPPQPLTRPEIVNQVIPNNVNPKDLPNDELKRLIQLQFEYYFSRENLSNDSYLVSQMDGDQYVAISTVAKFNQVRKLTSDMSLIVEALRESPYVQLDETEQKVRANMKRCIVILREIPEITPIEDVKALFAHPNCPKWISFEYAYNDNWYVTFECEDDAKRAYRYLREEVQSFQGRPLMARIKAKTLLSRTVFLPKNASATSTSTQANTSPPADSITTHFTTAQQPVSTFTVAHPQMFPQHNFPFYTTSATGNPGILPGTWISTTRFIQPEMRPKSNYNKYNNYQPNKPINGQRPYFPGSKPRNFRGNYNSPKIPFHERNGNVDYDDRPITNGPTNRRPAGSHTNHISSHTNNGSTSGVANNYRGRDDPRFVRHSTTGGGPRKEYRTNTEEGPRFQRLRERRVKDDPPTQSKHEKISVETDELTTQVNGELNLDLALENFPALPSPNSPNESLNGIGNRSASSLKELATNVLNETEAKNTKDTTSPSSSVSSDLSSTELMIPVSLVSSDSGSPTGLVITTTQPSVNNTIPKMLSYAQMAQKPNSYKESNSIDGEVKDSIDANLDPKKVTTKTEPKNTNNTQQTANGKTPRKANKSSPRSQRKRTPGTDKSNDKLSETNEQGPTSPVLKETYASKFGSAATDTKPNTSSPSRPKVNTNNPTAKGGLNIKCNTLPPPRPLMSQVISPPASKLDEVNGLQQQPPQQISFSDTVKKTTNDACLTPTSPKSIDLTAESSATQATTETIEADKGS